jgi:hypothetical protein
MLNNCFAKESVSECISMFNATSINITIHPIFYEGVVFLSQLPLLESLILFDSVICTLYFIKDYLLLKLSEKRVSKKAVFEYKTDIIKRYNKIYILDSIDRYLFYTLTFLNYKVVSGFIESEYLILGFIFMSLPNVQNSFMRIFKGPLEFYLENKVIFIKYSFSKLIISSFQGLHSDIDRIQNFHIFIIYNIISFDYLYACLRNYLFIYLLYFLRSRDYLYYYYKAIKTAYLWNTGYNFEQLSLYDAVFLANLVIKETRWNEMSKMEVVNMLYVLIDAKFSDPNSSLYVTGSMLMLQFFSLWSLVSLTKLIYFNYSHTSIYIVLATLIVISYVYKIQNKLRKVATMLICYYLILFNVNDLIITLVLISNNLVYYILGEIYFFISNIHSIRKVAKAYDKKKRPKIKLDITETEKEFIFVNGN